MKIKQKEKNEADKKNIDLIERINEFNKYIGNKNFEDGIKGSDLLVSANNILKMLENELEKQHVSLDDYNEYLKYYTKKYCFYNRAGINYEKQELILLKDDEIAYKFDIENDVARWFLPEAVYADKPENYHGEVLTFESKKEHEFMVIYDELDFDDDANIRFKFKGKEVQVMHFPRLFWLAKKYAGIKTIFEDPSLNAQKVSKDVEGCDKIVNFFTFQKEIVNE